RLHLGDDLFLELLVLALLRRRQRGVLQAEFDVLLLQAAQALERVRDGVEGFDHLGLQLGLDGGERQRILHLVFVVIALGRGAPTAIPQFRLRRIPSRPGLAGILRLFFAVGRRRLERGCCGGRRRRRRR